MLSAGSAVIIYLLRGYAPLPVKGSGAFTDGCRLIVPQERSEQNALATGLI
jgi:hypothetical protein